MTAVVFTTNASSPAHLLKQPGFTIAGAGGTATFDHDADRDMIREMVDSKQVRDLLEDDLYSPAGSSLILSIGGTGIDATDAVNALRNVLNSGGDESFGFVELDADAKLAHNLDVNSKELLNALLGTDLNANSFNITSLAAGTDDDHAVNLLQLK